MKYLVSIIMVLLMINFFAQAEEVITPAPVGATAKKIKTSDIKKIVDPNGSYANTMKSKKSGTEGTTQPCDTADAQGRCNPSPNHKTARVTNKGGAKTTNPAANDPVKSATGNATK